MKTPLPLHTRQFGLTLIELLIGMFLGVSMVAMTLPAFLSNVESFKLTKSIARTHENGRYALTEIARNLRTTGFRGCDTTRMAIINLTGDAAQDFIGGITGVERSADEAVPLIDENSYAVKTASDAIVIRTLTPVNALLTSDVSAGSTSLEFNTNHGVKAGDTIFLGNCEKSYLYKVSAVDLNEVTINAAVPANTQFDGGAIVYRFDTSTYFLAASKLYTNNQNGVPTSLWRKTNGAAPLELAAGIEHMQMMYGLDTDSDGIPNRFLNGTDVAGRFNDVSLVRFKVAVSSLDAVRHLGVIEKEFSMSVSVRNHPAW